MTVRGGLDQAGDTIVEVLIALAILSGALGIGYAAANSALRGIQGASEHAQALKIAQSQAEAIRINSENNSIYTSYFCLNGSAPQLWAGYNTPPPNSSADNFKIDYPGPCVQNLYRVFITYSGTTPKDPNGVFTINIRWPSIVTNGNDNVQLRYKVHHP